MQLDQDCRVSQEVLALAVESAPNGLLILNRRGRIVMVNRAVERLFGYARQELLGQVVEVLLPERYRERHLAQRYHYSSVHDDALRAMAGMQVTGLCKDGTEIPIQVCLSGFEAPRAALVLVTVIDRREQLQREAEVREAMRETEAANRAKSDFLARMSHEIRTPMNLILGMNATLLETELTVRQRQYLEIAQRNMQRLLRLTNGILDLAKVEAGAMVLHKAAFDLPDLLQEVMGTLRATAEKKGLRTTLEVAPGLCRCWVGDRERLAQVLLNLLGNAVKFTEHGEIRLRATGAVNTRGDAGIRVEVSDTGCGVRREKQQEIFGNFQQGDGSFSRSYEGSGLGLAIAKSLVEMMDGRIWVDDRPGPGTTFVFTVFLEPRESVDDSGRRQPCGKPWVAVPRGTRLLIAEDNPDNVFLVETFLEDTGIEWDVARDGAEALAKRQSGRYHVILMDIQMPVMDGYTATREIRRWEAAAGMERTPIVALTAHALAEASAMAEAAGCDGYLSKPVEREQLLREIGRFTRTAVEPGLAPRLKARLPEFLANRKHDLDALQTALARGDWSRMQRIGHDAKGIGRGFGFPGISVAGAAIESAARARDEAGVTEAIAHMTQEVDAAHRAS